MLDEKLSALIDDELDSDELSSCLNQLAREPGAREAWSSQHLLRAALKGQVTDPNIDLADSVMAAIDLEPAESAAVAPNSKVIKLPTMNWRTNAWAGGLALAASVAVVAVLSPLLFDSADNGVVSGNGFASNPASGTQQVAQRNRVKANDEARRELQQYLLDHEALASGHGLNSQRRYMRMASPGTTYVAYSPE